MRCRRLGGAIVVRAGGKQCFWCPVSISGMRVSSVQPTTTPRDSPDLVEIDNKAGERILCTASGTISHVVEMANIDEAGVALGMFFSDRLTGT